MATLTEHPERDRPYKAQIRIVPYPHQTRSFRTKKERTNWVALTEGQMRAGTWVDPEAQRHQDYANGTVADLLTRYTEDLGWPFSSEEKNGDKKFVYSNCTLLRKAAKEIGHLYPSELSIAYVEDYAHQLADHLSPRSVLGYWNVLEKAVRRWRKTYGVEMPENPFTETRQDLLDEGVMGSASERERRLEDLHNYTYLGSNPEYHGQTFRRINEYDVLMLELEWQDHYLVDIVDFALASTMRASHIMRIRFSDMDLEQNLINRIRKMKTQNRKRHEIWQEGVLPPAAVEVVRRVIAKREALPSLEQADRKALYDRVWEEPISTVCHEYGLSDNGLRKRLKRLNIPFPTQGYWQRLRKGADVSNLKKRLPPMLKSEQQEIGDFLFPYPGSGRAVCYAFNAICKRLGLEGLSFHVLRHEGISRLVEDPKQHAEELIMAVSGHESKASMKRYTHLRPGHQRRKWGAQIDAL